MDSIRYAIYKDAEILGFIHLESWKVAYKDIIPDSILENITAEKRTKYLKNALSKGW